MDSSRLAQSSSRYSYPWVGRSVQRGSNEDKGAQCFARLSVSSWEWIAAITLVVLAFGLLPYFLRTGITTISEFLPCMSYSLDYPARYFDGLRFGGHYHCTNTRFLQDAKRL